MPEHNGIRIGLVSQYDAMFIPEYQSPGDNGSLIATHGIDTYVPNYAGSQFWIRYACDATTQVLEIRFFYFKLYIGGEFAVAWGCGAQDEWKGETSFVLSHAVSIDDGGSTREKLGLFFPRDVEVSPKVPKFEIRVYRATARKRQERQYAPAAVVEGRDGGVQLGPVGIIKNRNPRRFYSYALVDPKDEPYARFRYHFRAHDELRRRGYMKRGISVVRPTAGSLEELQGSGDHALAGRSADLEEEEEDTSLLSPSFRTLNHASAS